MRVKKQIDDLGLRVWSQTVQFFCEKGSWHEKVWATALNEEQAKELVESYAGNKSEKFTVQIDCSVQDNLVLEDKRPNSIKPSVFGQIIWMSEQEELKEIIKGEM